MTFRSPVARSSRHAPVRVACSVAVALMLGIGAPCASAAPEQGDQIARFLQEQGLVPGVPAEGGLLEQMRSRASDLVITAMNFLGAPYRRGGTTAESGFDCSGFTRHVFEQSIGLLLPRRSHDQAEAAGLLDVRRDELKPGDLVFFNTMRRAFSHVGIYVGDNKFIHSPRTGSVVRVEDMRASYWTKRFNGARRVPLLSTAGTAGPVTETAARP